METLEFVSDVLDHTCTVIQAAEVAGDYGHTAFDWDNAEAVSEGVLCRYSPGSVREIISARMAGVDIQTHTLWLRFSDAPATLLLPGASLRHRVASLRRRDTGVELDAGPFDITDVVDMAGAHQLLRLSLKRIA